MMLILLLLLLRLLTKKYNSSLTFSCACERPHNGTEKELVTLVGRETASLSARADMFDSDPAAQLTGGSAYQVSPTFIMYGHVAKPLIWGVDTAPYCQSKGPGSSPPQQNLSNFDHHTFGRDTERRTVDPFYLVSMPGEESIPDRG